MRKKISKVWGKIRKISQNLRKKWGKWNSCPPGTVRLATVLPKFLQKVYGARNSGVCRSISQSKLHTEDATHATQATYYANEADAFFIPHTRLFFGRLFSHWACVNWITLQNSKINMLTLILAIATRRHILPTVLRTASPRELFHAGTFCQRFKEKRVFESVSTLGNINDCCPEGFSQTYFPKGVVATPLDYQYWRSYPQNPFRSIYACKRMPSAYPDDR